MPQQHITSAPSLRDLDGLSRFMSVAYILATVVLCSALIFSYFTLKRILIEQSKLNAFGATTSELRTTIRESTLYLNDLKAAKAATQSESRLELKINSRMNDVLVKIDGLKNAVSSQLESLDGYGYYEDFNNTFNGPPDNIWLKLDQYVNRLKEISIDSRYGAPGSDLLWLPVEATAAKNGALGKSYEAAFSKLQSITEGRSKALTSTHKTLTLVSLSVVILELLLIFLPLRRRLESVNKNLLSAHENLFMQANYDKQTSLPNVSGISKKLQNKMPDEQFSSLLIIILENVDSISRIVGPTALELFFQEFTKKLSNIDTSENLIFRAGDHEFAILQKSDRINTNATTVHNIQSVLNHRLYIENAIVHPKTRLGYTKGDVTAGNLRNKLIDARLAAQNYSLSEKVIPKYESSMRSNIEDENLLVEKIRIGLSKNEFIPYYQLKVDAKTGLVSGMEALCRWQLADGSILSPFKFIPVAEKSGLITEITWQLLDQIAIDYNTWTDAGLQPGRVAFNADEVFLREVDFSERITKIVKATNSIACPIDLEITENVALGRESEAISSAISIARDLGMQIALDDFGTGYASLSSIVGLDVDIIKVDQSFVHMMSENAESKSIVLTLIYLCQQLNKKCVVEGVETKEEFEFCRDLGCDEIQGYYFYKPAPFSEVMDALSAEQIIKKAS